MTHEEAIESLRDCAKTLRHIAKLTESLVSGVEMKHRKATEALKQPQESKMTREQAIEKAVAELAQFRASSWRVIVKNGSVWETEFFGGGGRSKITAVMRDTFNNLVVGVGRSRCAKGDVYNADIGKLIALYRALGREVPAWLLHIPQE